MKIGLMGAWNTDSGAAMHAELIGRSFVEKGHEIAV
ncbi:MAG: glycosyltransferase family 1 protein, partial [Candidatus Lokiarchaeota archaeon]|nr:glycosyltransferase family 1 protein [Candidatus Lokiarchaeota archaeon]